MCYTGGWSTAGVRLLKNQINGRDVCQIDHLTNFAVLIVSSSNQKYKSENYVFFSDRIYYRISFLKLMKEHSQLNSNVNIKSYHAR